jgi:hypothetical protein
MDVVMNSRQRAVHMVNALGATSSADDIRNAYNMARISRAAIRNAASSNNDLDLQVCQQLLIFLHILTLNSEERYLCYDRCRRLVRRCPAI